jgi:hypothetical protein
MKTFTVTVQHGVCTSTIKVMARHASEAMDQALLILSITYQRVERIVVSGK